MAESERSTEPRSGMDEAELDRLVERSLAATSQGNPPPAPPPRRRSWGWITAAIIGALLVGTLASPWVEQRLRALLPGDPLPEPAPVVIAAEPPSVDAAMGEFDARVQSLEASLAALATNAPTHGDSAGTAALEARIAALEAVINRYTASQGAVDQRLDAMTQAIATLSGGGEARAQRVEGFLLLTTVRRLMAAGRPLGPLLGPLGQRSALAEPEAVEALRAWSEAPVTRQSLTTRLDMPPADPAPSGNWLSRLSNRLGGLFDVRDARNAPRNAATQAARTAMEADALDAAIRAMAAQPPNADVNAWLVDARRLAAAESALERLDQLLLAAMLADFSQPAPAPAGDISAAPQQ